MGADNSKHSELLIQGDWADLNTTAVLFLATKDVKKEKDHAGYEVDAYCPTDKIVLSNINFTEPKAAFELNEHLNSISELQGKKFYN
jgi:hypothetical protein